MKYQCMFRPCTIQSDELLWCIEGTSENHGSGILAWCYDEEDAKYWFDLMREDEDFYTLSYSKFTEDKLK